MQAELRDLGRTVATGTREAGRGLKTELRRQVDSAGLGRRIDNRWSDGHYSNQKPCWTTPPRIFPRLRPRRGDPEDRPEGLKVPEPRTPLLA